MRRVLTQVPRDAAVVVAARADRVDRFVQRVFEFRDVAGVERLVLQQVAAVEQREYGGADLEEIAGVAEEELPLRDVRGIGMETRLRVDPGVVDVAVEHRALEALDDAELRVEARLTQ